MENILTEWSKINEEEITEIARKLHSQVSLSLAIKIIKFSLQ